LCWHLDFKLRKPHTFYLQCIKLNIIEENCSRGHRHGIQVQSICIIIPATCGILINSLKPLNSKFRHI
uniref:Uncharacterized protein n=1 Tax=Macaca fascicularis TaxID=9541 RepID=A0A7N9C8K8_MACFA